MVNDFSKDIAKALREYTSEVEAGLQVSKKEVAKETAGQLKQTSPKLTGDYAKGWGVSTIKGRMVVHNKTDYQLTHLLEYGHVDRGGGRTAGKAHIRPAEEQAIKEFVDRVEKVIKG